MYVYFTAASTYINCVRSKTTLPLSDHWYYSISVPRASCATVEGCVLLCLLHRFLYPPINLTAGRYVVIAYLMSVVWPVLLGSMMDGRSLAGVGSSSLIIHWVIFVSLYISAICQLVRQVEISRLPSSSIYSSEGPEWPVDSSWPRALCCPPASGYLFFRASLRPTQPRKYLLLLLGRLLQMVATADHDVHIRKGKPQRWPWLSTKLWCPGRSLARRFLLEWTLDGAMMRYPVRKASFHLWEPG